MPLQGGDDAEFARMLLEAIAYLRLLRPLRALRRAWTEAAAASIAGPGWPDASQTGMRDI